MKKLLYLFLAITVACSSGDDSNDDNNQNSIIGNWQLTCICEDGLPVDGVPMSYCDLQSNITFLESNTGDYKYYDEEYSGSEEDCIEEVRYFTWSQESSSSYYILGISPEENPQLAIIDGNTLTVNDNGLDVVFVKN